MRRIVTAEEWDAYSKSRKIHGYLLRAGVVKKIKRRTHKRERKEAKIELHVIDRSDNE